MILISTAAFADVSDDFLQAVAAGNVEQAELLLGKGADINAKYTTSEAGMSYGETAIIIASSSGNEAMVKMLLDNEANPNITNEGYSAIIYATNNGFIEIVNMLIEKGADVNQVHVDGTTPLINAVLSDNVEMVKLLLDKGADPSIKDYGENSALDYAKSMKNSKIIALLER
jgi:ankyrin repeat protein